MAGRRRIEKGLKSKRFPFWKCIYMCVKALNLILSEILDIRNILAI